jgi:hypothetical protein
LRGSNSAFHHALSKWYILIAVKAYFSPSTASTKIASADALAVSKVLNNNTIKINNNTIYIMYNILYKLTYDY